jgi:hypothetical protein
MIRRRWVVSLVLMSFGPIAGGSGAESVTSPDQAEYRRHLKEGDDALRQGDLESARLAYVAADGVELFEVPNYGARVKIAEVECRLGDVTKGLETLADFRCMVEVDGGVKPCYVGGGGDPGAGAPNPALSATCFHRMCGEIYLGYYTQVTRERRKILRALSRDADRVAGVCESEGAPGKR